MAKVIHTASSVALLLQENVLDHRRLDQGRLEEQVPLGAGAGFEELGRPERVGASPGSQSGLRREPGVQKPRKKVQVGLVNFGFCLFFI